MSSIVLLEPLQIRTCPRLESERENGRPVCRLWFAVENGHDLAFDYRRDSIHISNKNYFHNSCAILFVQLHGLCACGSQL